ncbi:MAG: hypothetical protein ABI068_10475 [Ktedonobacterales bacterium]
MERVNDMGRTEQASQASQSQQAGQAQAAPQRLHTWLLRLYPSVWRDRYGEEFLALLADRGISAFSFLDMLDVFYGALDARLAPQLADTRGFPMLNRLRKTLIVVFCAYILYVLSGTGFYGLLDDNSLAKSSLANLQNAVYVVQAGAGISLLAILIGGLPIGFAALRSAWSSGRRSVLALLGTPILAFLVVIGSFLALVAIEKSQGTSVFDAKPGQVFTPNVAVVAAYFTAVAIWHLAAIVSTAAMATAIARSPISERLYRFARIPALVAALAMLLTLGGVVAWGIIANGQASAQFQHDLGFYGLTTMTSWIIVTVTMTIAVLVALVALARGGWRGEAAAAHQPGIASQGA